MPKMEFLKCDGCGKQSDACLPEKCGPEDWIEMGWALCPECWERLTRRVETAVNEFLNYESSLVSEAENPKKVMLMLLSRICNILAQTR